MNFKNKFKNDINKSIDVTNSYSKITSKLSFNEENKGVFTMKNKKLVWGLSLGCSCAVVVGLGLGLGLGLNQNKTGEATSMVTMSVNPKISMVLDRNNCVLSVSGDNNEGKIVLSGENLVGLNVDEAVAKVIQIENECGYLVSGQVTADQNKIEFTVDVNSDTIKESIQKALKETVTSTCDKYNIDEQMSYATSLTKEALIALVVEIEPSLTTEDCANMSYEELLKIVSNSYNEYKEFYTVELENLYKQTKEYEIKFADTEETKEIISSISSLYSTLVATIDNVITELRDAVNDLEKVNYNYFVKEDSDYQVSYKAFLEAKENVITLRNQIANSDASEDDKAALDAQLALKQTLLETAISTMDDFKESAQTSINSGKETINTLITTINNFMKALPGQDTVESTLKEKASELEKKANEVKNKCFEEFESKYKAEMANAKQKALDYKAQLKAKIAK